MANYWQDDDSFEKLERGGSRQKTPQIKPKQTSVSDVQKKLLELSTDSTAAEASKTFEKTVGSKSNFTPINVDQLGKKYKEQDNPELQKVRERLHYFRLQQPETQRAIDERAAEKQERKRKELEEEEEKKQQRQQQITAPMETPKGKERKSIFSFKKKKRTQVEVKPGSGKQ